MNNNYLFRVQDQDGRGPFKPGFSHNWVIDREDNINLIPYMMEFDEDKMKLINEHIRNGLHLGCGCRTIEKLRRWFTKKEYATLIKYGYKAVAIKYDTIIAESETQCVFSNKDTLNKSCSIIRLY